MGGFGHTLGPAVESDILKPSCTTSHPYRQNPQISEQSIQWLMRTLPYKIWRKEKEAEEEETEQNNKFGRLIIRASVMHIIEVSNLY